MKSFFTQTIYLTQKKHEKRRERRPSIPRRSFTRHLIFSQPSKDVTPSWWHIQAPAMYTLRSLRPLRETKSFSRERKSYKSKCLIVICGGIYGNLCLSKRNIVQCAQLVNCRPVMILPDSWNLIRGLQQICRTAPSCSVHACSKSIACAYQIHCMLWPSKK